VADDFAALNRKLAALADQLKGPPMRAVTSRVTLKAKRVVEAEYRKDVGADMRMSNWHRGTGQGVKTGVGFDLVSDHVAKMRPRPSGPAKTLEDGSLSHSIESKAGKVSGRGSSRVRAGRAIARAAGTRGGFAGSKPMPVGAGFAFRVRHRGSRGKGTWARGMTKVERQMPQWVNDEVGDVLGRVLNR